MRLIPVIDLLDGQVVHAIRGQRKNYRPVKSVLCDIPDPIKLARAFRDRLGLNEIYIADLNAIQGSGRTDHRDQIAALAQSESLNIMLDAGISSLKDIQAWLRLGIHKAVIGAETLNRLAVVREIPARIVPDRIVFSLDLRAGKILSNCPEFAALSPLAALEHLQSAGWKEVILLDLGRVGSGGGVDRTLVNEVRAKHAGLSLLVGGGISNPEQLLELQSLGVAGVLVATALHRGAIAPQHLTPESA